MVACLILLNTIALLYWSKRMSRYDEKFAVLTSALNDAQAALTASKAKELTAAEDAEINAQLDAATEQAKSLSAPTA